MKNQVIINNEVVKEYPHKLQAIIYLVLKGFCYSGKGHHQLDDRVEIKEEK